jgi:hypothetical protein
MELAGLEPAMSWVGAIQAVGRWAFDAFCLFRVSVGQNTLTF